MQNKELYENRILLGNTLFRLRTENGITKRQLAIHSGIGRNIIDSMERGDSAYTIDSYIKYLHTVERLSDQALPEIKFLLIK